MCLSGVVSLSMIFLALPRMNRLRKLPGMSNGGSHLRRLYVLWNGNSSTDRSRCRTEGFSVLGQGRVAR